MIQAAIFDLDGTLFDTKPDLFPAFNAAVEKFGYPPCTEERFGHVIGAGHVESLVRILPPDFHDDEKLQKMADLFVDLYNHHFADHTYPYPGMHEALLELHQKGIRLAVLSNKLGSQSKELCRIRLGDIPFFAICGSGEGYPMKPDPAYLHAILQSMQVNPENAVFIGDSDVDIFTAQNGGLKSIGCCWGYRGEEELRSAGADRLADSASQLPEIIASL